MLTSQLLGDVSLDEGMFERAAMGCLDSKTELVGLLDRRFLDINAWIAVALASTEEVRAALLIRLQTEAAPTTVPEETAAPCPDDGDCRHSTKARVPCGQAICYGNSAGNPGWSVSDGHGGFHMADPCDAVPSCGRRDGQRCGHAGVRPRCA